MQRVTTSAPVQPELTLGALPTSTITPGAIRSASTLLLSSPAADISDNVLCSYPGKKCSTARAVKPNGTMHKLCELHRRRANLNQKRLQQKRRVLRDKLFKRASGVSGKTIACDMLYDLATPPQSPHAATRTSYTSMLYAACHASPSSASSPVPAHAHAQQLLPTYADQVAYLFADPLLQPLICPAAFTHEFSAEDMDLLQDALFDDSMLVHVSNGLDDYAMPGVAAQLQVAWHANL